MDIDKALKAMPKEITYDPMEHTSISDLLFLVQHELDLMSEEPEHFEHASKADLINLKRKCVSFIKKYSK
ncbi:hypothetical protein BC351_00500 [Paenibacillus ferrarius]|uniref:Uncharacterized protein n=1 Tax=Paenibacillus ferrarius TaxID=1469647 RepID=A0A1V4HSA9_9BACL|nr:hypothetical protein [Paenibacillus ferrarius]OPH61756.1 hypothetical protein BC351_00500 [Paenibacillus ferrarius]